MGWHQNCNQGRLRSETRIPLFVLLSLHLCSYVRCLQRRRWWWRRDYQRRRPSHPLAELKGACKKFSGHPLVGAAQLGMPDSYGNVESVFMEMDADGKGMVLLNEWCAWLEKKESENQTPFGKLLLKGENVVQD